ncbi:MULTISPECIES: hypothetical protein [unclassified Streptomyces]|uniref:hypothetical protein n=1 Tax=unclassified Streptomyces TaxID=2593676 RepID=UPI000DBA0F0D|nr:MULTISPECIES: hypothetical protein [unclassified Streptomyces]MYT71777.1 hypothetical protein [Streptomyces sp. SID8367]RAJ72611.1 hypothetical protein K377_07393 [Streptomyces sp. PsTaAH-137]
MDAALIAVLGTLLGSVVTHFFQGRATVRSAELARAEQVRQERISSYSAFAGALHDYRRSQNDRWFRSHENAPEAVVDASRFTSYESRITARSALTRVQLICDDTRLRQLAEEAFEFVNCLHEATDAADRDRRSLQSKRTLDAFVSAAAPTVR